jgi:hypothetical protein
MNQEPGSQETGVRRQNFREPLRTIRQLLSSSAPLELRTSTEYELLPEPSRPPARGVLLAPDSWLLTPI